MPTHKLIHDDTGRAMWACLQAEVQKNLSLRTRSDDFAPYVKGACSQETQAFRVPWVDYLAMKHPDIDASTHLTTGRVHNPTKERCGTRSMALATSRY
jgi:hypothetical protein